eukprot:TRINITY_DN27899_c0_g1_i1.p1 TRINITY_DN27899_c0_g1~~TRINITY_DN27899_c0_g1_i1.p1  ORF type:complete len:509 (+),score=161.38 TRINITY_DN27899_c0_g1_i1:77-1528(+)
MEPSFVVQNFIDGQFVAPVGAAYFDNINPSNGLPYGKVPDSEQADVSLAVAAAKKAFKTWSKTTTEQRSQLLYRIADVVESRLQEFAEAESKDQGKPVSLAKTVDIPRVCANFRFYAGAILHHEERSTRIDGLAVNYTTRTPVGVCGLISPWNLPLYLLTWKIAPAIAVGNTCVCKPSEFTPATAFLLCSVLNEVGLPPGVVNMVFGYGAKAGSPLVRHPDVPLISFTGGTATAEHIIRDSAPLYKKLYLELGGKNPNIIFDDCNFDECVATSVRSSFANQGEICLCGSRILVQDTIYDRFVEAFVAATRKLVVGDPRLPSTNVGALVSEVHRNHVEKYIALARTEGTILCGGDRPSLPDELSKGYYLNPTVITDLSPSCRVQQEEIFGPVVGITKFSTEEEAIEIANSTRYGLAAMVWTEHGKRAHRVSQALEVGTVWVNCWMVRDLRMPFGGQKHSGIGRAGGDQSIDLYTEQKTICMKTV